MKRVYFILLMAVAAMTLMSCETLVAAHNDFVDGYNRGQQAVYDRYNR